MLTAANNNYPNSNRMAYLAFGGLALILLCGIAAPRCLSFAPAVWGLAVFAGLFVKTKSSLYFDKSLFKFAIAVLLLGASSAIWYTDTSFAFEKTLKTAAVFFGGFILLTAGQNVSLCKSKANLFPLFLTILSALSALLIFSEYQTDFSLSRLILNAEEEKNARIEGGFLLNRSMVFLVLLSLPVCLALYMSDNSRKIKQAAFAFFLLCTTLALWKTNSQTAQLTAIVIPLMLLYPAHKKIARRFLAGSILLALWVFPFLVSTVQTIYSQLDPALSSQPIVTEASVPHRLEVWNFIADKIQEAPVLGHGIEATRFLKADQKMELMNSYTVLHPHNFFLQIWIEFGMIGAALFSAFLIFLFKRMDALGNATEQKYYATLLVSILCVLSFGYGIWQGWQIGMIFTLAAMSMMAIKIYAPKSA